MASSGLKLADSKFLRYIKSYVFLSGKRTGFYGNFGHGDLGDDASFLVAQKLLGKDLLPFSKRCYAFNPRILKAFLIGGGGNLRWECPYIPRKLLLKEKWNFPVILFSAGINCDYGKEYTEETKGLLRRLCKICDYITVRDFISQRFIKSLGFKDVYILPDLELLLEEKQRQFGFKKKGFTVGIVLSPHSEFNSATLRQIVDSFSQFVNYLIRRNYNVLFLPFEHNNSENTREKEITREIMKKVENKHMVRVMDNDISPEEMLFMIKKYCDVMVCMRLHSVIFAVDAGIPFVCVSFNLMHKGFLEMVDSSELEISLLEQFSSEKLRDRFEYVCDNYDGIKSRLIKKRDYLRSEIYSQAAKIKKILER